MYILHLVIFGSFIDNIEALEPGYARVMTHGLAAS
jgi:hypothetical protein